MVTMLLTGENPISIYTTIFYGAFGTARRTWVTVQDLAILLGISLAVTPAFKMRFWNIGAEGQVLIGGLATTACMICLADKLPNAVMILRMLAASILAAGALWGFLPAFFKARVEHQRNSVHPDDELHRHAAGRLLHHRVGGPQGRRQDRHHQPEHGGRLAAPDRRTSTC